MSSRIPVFYKHDGTSHITKRRKSSYEKFRERQRTKQAAQAQEARRTARWNRRQTIMRRQAEEDEREAREAREYEAHMAEMRRNIEQEQREYAEHHVRLVRLLGPEAAANIMRGRLTGMGLGGRGVGGAVQQTMNKPESSGQLKKWTARGTPVIDIPTFVSKYGGNLQPLLQKTGKAVILYVTQRTPGSESGHWTGLIDHGARGLEAFDSYGLAPDAEYKFIPPAAKAAANEVQKHILPALQGSGRPYVYNHKRLQSWSPSVQTCGRHVAVRLAHSDMPLPQYVAWLENSARQQKTTPDAIVSQILP